VTLSNPLRSSLRSARSPLRACAPRIVDPVDGFFYVASCTPMAAANDQRVLLRGVLTSTATKPSSASQRVTPPGGYRLQEGELLRVTFDRTDPHRMIVHWAVAA
jgi:hypothetical protein